MNVYVFHSTESHLIFYTRFVKQYSKARLFAVDNSGNGTINNRVIGLIETINSSEEKDQPKVYVIVIDSQSMDYSLFDEEFIKSRVSMDDSDSLLVHTYVPNLESIFFHDRQAVCSHLEIDENDERIKADITVSQLFRLCNKIYFRSDNAKQLIDTIDLAKLLKNENDLQDLVQLIS